MFAVITNGSHQYKVIPGEVIRCNKISGMLGDKISFSSPILVSDGSSLLNAKEYIVNATIFKQYRDEKIIVFKKKRRKDYKKKRGHRSYLTLLQIDSIEKK
jgi:large subunit ribosomal protein L21